MRNTILMATTAFAILAMQGPSVIPAAHASEVYRYEGGESLQHNSAPKRTQALAQGEGGGRSETMYGRRYTQGADSPGTAPRYAAGEQNGVDNGAFRQAQAEQTGANNGRFRQAAGEQNGVDNGAFRQAQAEQTGANNGRFRQAAGEQNGVDNGAFRQAQAEQTGVNNARGGVA